MNKFWKALRILGDEANLGFLKCGYDFYGFDYDLKDIGVIWPFYTTMKQLKKDLTLNGIKFEEIKIEFEFKEINK